MKPEIAKLWIEALRSGVYKQGKGCLKTGDSLCCLGVLCDQVRAGGMGEWEYNGNEFGYGKGVNDFEWKFKIGENTFWSCLPKEVVAWAGLKSDNGFATDNLGAEISLSHMNDKGKSFLEIAQVIEENMEYL